MKKHFVNSSNFVKSFIGRCRKRFREYADLCLTSGFMPRRFRPVQFIAKYVTRIWVFIQVGRVRIVGAENLLADGRIIFCPNHSSMFDALVIYSIMKRQPRYMAAFEEMRGLGGFKAVVMGAAGCFPVDRSRGRTVIQPAIDTLVGGEYLVIFPEGKISNSGEYLPFKRGSARIAIAACAALEHKEPVGIVPIHICYHKRDEATAGASFGEIGFKWRGGVTVTVGKPVYVHNFVPLTEEHVTNEVRKAITQQPCPTTHLPE